MRNQHNLTNSRKKKTIASSPVMTCTNAGLLTEKGITKKELCIELSIVEDEYKSGKYNSFKI